MGTIKERNGMDLTVEEDIKKRWQEYKEELYKKDLHDPDNQSWWCDHSSRARHPGMFKLVLEKAKEPEIKLPTFAASLKKQ